MNGAKVDDKNFLRGGECADQANIKYGTISVQERMKTPNWGAQNEIFQKGILFDELYQKPKIYLCQNALPRD